MSPESEKIKKLVQFKKKVKSRVEELKSQIEEQQSILEVVNSILVEKGFKRAEITKEEKAEAEVPPPSEEAPAPPTPQPSPKYEKTIPLKTGTGELLANLNVDQNSIHIVPAEDKNFNINTPPFPQFLVERVLTKMEEKDNKLVKAGKLTADQVFSYHIIQEDDNIRELVIKNFSDKRLKELKSTTRWTLEKMYEKTEEQT